eukprot:7111172-Prymnesium_polylepis.1
MTVLNKLRRLPENKKCGSCNYEDRMGFKNVCMKFKIFICDDCKSAHQAYSHRCKVRRARSPSRSQTRWPDAARGPRRPPELP